MKKKMSVPMPEKKIAVLGSKPMSKGPRTVEPNIASTCCRPTKMGCPQGSRSSGAMTPSVFSLQLGRYACISFSTDAIFILLASNEGFKEKVLRLWDHLVMV